MTDSKETVSFDDIIQADRLKRKNEALANEILTRNRRTTGSGSGFGYKRQSPTPGSLASRIGVVKRSASATFRPTQNPFGQPGSPRNSRSSRPASANRRHPHDLFFDTRQATIRDNGITIKGTGTGKFIIQGSNFAPGTTAADIQSTFEPVGGDMLSCRITSQFPTVRAEMVFADRSGAENVVASFHNTMADGRILSMRLKVPSATSTGSESDFNPPTGPRAQSNFNASREQTDHGRRENRRADPQIQDGSYGFDPQNGQPQSRDGRGGSRYNNQRDDNYRRDRHNGRGGRGRNRDRDRDGDIKMEDQKPGLYSDEMIAKGPPNNGQVIW
ncbi:hypothetical protein Egran_05648 [Elaphomyces granulatus]|uniref:RRM domain-containing protein n=1 Tax=Elaphomyces granulatus TaxID=519963 RepID=A0A232LRD2_9EURO|nr:hypothetical protein Egran_05648 [Elaphomyces granulatus]